MAISEPFRGEFGLKVDGKARVSIPAPFRRVLEADDPLYTGSNRPRVILVYGVAREPYVDCYSIAGMDRLVAKILRMPEGGDERRIAERSYITRSHTTEVDDDGRIVLPSQIKKKLQVADEPKAGFEVTFAGALNSFHLWRQDVYEAMADELDAAEDDKIPHNRSLLSVIAQHSAES